MSEALDCVELDPPSTAHSSVIWLHGLGADGHDFVPLVPQLRLPAAHGVRFLFPHAPRIPVTVNMGLVMPAWYDIRSLTLKRDVDEEGVKRSSDALTALIDRERAAGIPARRIVLAGFSQGGAVALHVALRHPERLAGVLALSTYLVRGDSLDWERSDANRDVPIFQAHGTYDPMVPQAAGEKACNRLRGLGYRVDWRTYPMAHEVHPEEIAEIGRQLQAMLPEPGGQDPD